MARAITIISDCQAVLCSRIGPGACDELTGRGMLPFEVRDLVEPAIKAYLNYTRAMERVGQREGK